MPEIIVKLGDRIIHRYFFDKDALSVGRARDNDIVIENLSVSRNHCRMKKQDGKYILTDMNSANGTLVNGVRVTKAEVVHNDVISVGKHVLLFVDSEQAAAAGTGTRTPTDGGGVAAAAAALEGLIGVLTVTKGKQSGQEFRIVKAETFIGRAPESDIRLHDWFVSKKHACVRRNGDSYSLKDLDSWRGTTVNGHSIKDVELKEEDEVVFGTTVLKFRRVTADELARMPARPAPAPTPASMDGPPPPEVAEQDAREEQDAADGADFLVPDPGPVATHHMEGEGSPPPDDDDEGISLSDEDMGSDLRATGDEFAPFTEDELEALEVEADLHDHSHDESMEERRVAWEDIEAEKMFEMGEENFSLVESDDELRKAEEDAVGSDALAGLEARAAARTPDETQVALEDAEEEEALHEEAPAEPAPAKKPKKDKKAPELDPAVATAAPEDTAVKVNAAVEKEVRMWEKALKNKSAVIRKNAAKELKKLTGKDYDWQSEPN